MFDKTITWGELITIVLFILGAVLLIVLILAIVNLLRILKNFNKLLEKNTPHLSKTMEKLPEITDNAAKITGSIKKNMETIDQVFEDIGKVTGTVKKSVETFQKDILGKGKIFVDIVEAVKKFFDKRKANPKPAKKKGTLYKYSYKKGQDDPENIEIMTNEAVEGSPYTGYDKTGEEGPKIEK